MVDRTFLNTERYKAQQWRADRVGAHPDILEFERRFIKRLAKTGVPMFTHCVMRGDIEQNNMFERGASRAKAGRSPHNYGMAADIVHSTKAWGLSVKQWEIVGHIGKEVAAQAGIKVEWGGDWKFYDPAHWELSDWKVGVIA